MKKTLAFINHITYPRGRISMNNELDEQVRSLVEGWAIKIEIGGPGYHDVTDAEADVMLQALLGEPVDPQEAERLMRLIDAAPEVLAGACGKFAPMSEPELGVLLDALASPSDRQLDGVEPACDDVPRSGDSTNGHWRV